MTATNLAKASAGLIFILILATAIGPLAMSSFLPAIPEIQAEFNTSPAVAQLTMSVSMVSMAVFALIYGALADRYGRRPVLLLGIAIAVVGSLICALAPSITWAIVGRALQASGATSGMILTRVIVHDVYGDKRTASVLGYITASMTLAPIIGPVFGGLLIDLYDWRYVFVALTIFAMGLWLALYAQLPETRPDGLAAARRLVPVSDFVSLLTRGLVRRLILYAAVAHSTFMAFLGGVPFLIAVYYDLPATMYALYVLPVPLGFMLGGLLAGRYSERFDRFAIMRWSAWASMAAMMFAMLLLESSWHSPWVVCLPTGFVALAIAFALPAVQTEVMSEANSLAGSASGLLSFCQLVVGAVVAQAVGWTATFGPYGVVLMMLACAILALILILLPGNDKLTKLATD